MTTTNNTLSNGLDIKLVSPRKGAKFSPNLYRWLTSPTRKHRALHSRIYLDQLGDLWIGTMDMGDFIGARLIDVLCNGTKATTGCMAGLRGLEEVADFWTRYMRDGRCAIDVSHTMHFLGDDTRWTTKDDTRACLWCGNCTQRLHRWVAPIERQQWRTVETPHGNFEERT